jgi:hypothetical protein
MAVLVWMFLIFIVGIPLCVYAHKKGWLPDFPCGCGSTYRPKGTPAEKEKTSVEGK